MTEVWKVGEVPLLLVSGEGCVWGTGQDKGFVNCEHVIISPCEILV